MIIISDLNSRGVYSIIFRAGNLGVDEKIKFFSEIDVIYFISMS